MNTKNVQNWNDIRLGDVADVYSGFAFKSEDQTTTSLGGTPIIKIANINKKFVSKHSVNYFPKNSLREKHNKYILKKDDVLVAMTGAGSVGKIGKMMDVNDIYLVNQRVAIIRINENLADPEYIYQTLTESKYEEYLYNLGLGAGQPNISPDDIKSLLIPSPDIKTQHSISSILATYNFLIENNTNRIKILEEVAQKIYTEWFVNFRFPGYEKVKFGKNGLPEGWKMLPIGEVLSVKYGKNLPTTKISISGRYPVYGAGGVIGYYNEKNIDDKTVLVTSRGNGSGTVWRTKGAGFVTNNSFTINGKDDFSYLNFATISGILSNANVMGAKSGSAQPQITITSLDYIEVLMASKNFIEEYQEQSTRLYEMSDELFSINENLKKSRDLLVPQLVTGKLEINI